jgi:DNA-binding NarL/FixJ family response regulator
MSALGITERSALRGQSAVPSAERVRVIIADTDGLARSMMQSALRDVRRIAVIATTASALEVLELVRYYQPTVLIVDTSLLRNRGVKLVSSVRAATTVTRVLTISIDDDQTALAALRAGAVGHLSKDIDPCKLAELVVRAAAGEAIVPRRLVTALLDRLPELPDGGWRPLHSRLTTREWEIIALLGEGASTQDIAERLVLSVTTVYSHVKSVLRKLGVHSRNHAVLAAERLRREETMGEKAPHVTPIRFPDPGQRPGNVSEQPAIPAANGSRSSSAVRRAGYRP